MTGSRVFMVRLSHGSTRNARTRQRPVYRRAVGGDRP